MPYRREGKNVLHEKGGKWTIKQRCSSEANAKKAIRLLYGIEGGEWRPTGEPSKLARKIVSKSRKKR